MQGQSPPAPIRGTTKKAGAEEEGDAAEEEEVDGGAGDIMDLLPRTDIRSVRVWQCFQIMDPSGSFWMLVEKKVQIKRLIFSFTVIKSRMTWCQRSVTRTGRSERRVLMRWRPSFLRPNSFRPASASCQWH